MRVDNIDNLIKDEINKEKVPEKFSNMLNHSIDKCQEKQKSNIKVYKYVALFLLLIIMGSLSSLIASKNLNSNISSKIIDSNFDISNNNEVEEKKITNEKYDMIINQGLASTAPYRDESGKIITSEEYADCILLLKINELNSGIYYYPNSDNSLAYPFTFAIATVEKVYKGEKNIGEEMKFRKDGAIISYMEYERTLLPIQIEKQGLFKMSDEDKLSKYVKVTDSYTKSEINKSREYLVYLKYDDKYFNCYRVVGCEDGFREYDKNTNLFKNNKTNEFEELKIKLN